MAHAMADSGAEVYVPEATSERYYLSFGEIAEDVIYVDIMSARECSEHMARCTQSVNEVLKAADSSFGAITLALREQNGEIALLGQYGSDSAFEALSSQDLIREKMPVVSLDGQDYICAYLDFGAGENHENCTGL